VQHRVKPETPGQNTGDIRAWSLVVPVSRA